MAAVATGSESDGAESGPFPASQLAGSVGGRLVSWPEASVVAWSAGRKTTSCCASGSESSRVFPVPPQFADGGMPHSQLAARRREVLAEAAGELELAGKGEQVAETVGDHGSPGLEPLEGLQDRGPSATRRPRP
jgi:hypothetical protein